MAMRVESMSDASVVLRQAASFLASRPVLHNLVTTLLHARVAHPEPGRYWVAFDGEEIVGVTLQSPLDFPATLTPTPDAAVSAVVSTIAAEGVVLPGVIGDAATTARFAGEWTEHRRGGATPDSGQRVYELGELSPARFATGRLRPVEQTEEDVVVGWLEVFREETGERVIPPPIVQRRLVERQLWFWDDGGPVSFAGHARPVNGVARLGPVFTPPELRNRGYGSACVAALSRHLTGQGLRCILYADLANPVSNSIYRRMGYQAVVEILRYRFA